MVLTSRQDLFDTLLTGNFDRGFESLIPSQKVKQGVITRLNRLERGGFLFGS